MRLHGGRSRGRAGRLAEPAADRHQKRIGQGDPEKDESPDPQDRPRGPAEAHGDRRRSARRRQAADIVRHVTDEDRSQRDSQEPGAAGREDAEDHEVQDVLREEAPGIAFRSPSAPDEREHLVTIGGAVQHHGPGAAGLADRARDDRGGEAGRPEQGRNRSAPSPPPHEQGRQHGVDGQGREGGKQDRAAGDAGEEDGAGGEQRREEYQTGAWGAPSAHRPGAHPPAGGPSRLRKLRSSPARTSMSSRDSEPRRRRLKSSTQYDASTLP